MPSPPDLVVIASRKGSHSPGLKPISHQFTDRLPKCLSPWYMDATASVNRPVSLTNKKRQPDEPGTIPVNQPTVENAERELGFTFQDLGRAKAMMLLRPRIAR